ncbi:hypothetical protein Cylst_0876 [Cylindrospermum stagnale PCC 7417]|uniref:DUF4145 domain-containing protein n=1 Tax=Cylindrospermum stagnale PCC 7417 TaxID=56107 RepID=K9WUK2_9NOST|nr:DUF4145 domain-containing protein [Cylindrospermum stagnale]AFZ23202.1 hypothetical protein Cylst_0876 [Cylindrospermum stagnale PCC 7417]
MNPKQEIIKNRIEGLSNLDIGSRLRGIYPFHDWLKSVSVALKAARIQDELKIWEDSLPHIWDLSYEDSMFTENPSHAQVSFAKDILLGFLNNLSDDDKPSAALFPMEIVQDTRDYVFRIAQQVNTCYANACYDACAVMLRRLIETLIIECFEHNAIASKIKDTNNNYVNLDQMIGNFINESIFNLSRETKNNLHKLKAIGDKSAHNRYYTANRDPLDNLSQEIHVIIRELVNKSGVKK